jgi:hypothetical protein
MGDLGRLLDLLDLRPDDAALEVEERWQIATVQVRVFVDGRRQYGTAILSEPGRIVRPAPEEREFA